MLLPFSRIVSMRVTLKPSGPSSYSSTSSRTMLTNTSKPLSVPTCTVKDKMLELQILQALHLDMSQPAECWQIGQLNAACFADRHTEGTLRMTSIVSGAVCQRLHGSRLLPAPCHPS